MLTEKKIKDKYKIDREQIRVEQISNRFKVYVEINEKKKKWNEELVNKVELIEFDIEKERCRMYGNQTDN